MTHAGQPHAGTRQATPSVAGDDEIEPGDVLRIGPQVDRNELLRGRASAPAKATDRVVGSPAREEASGGRGQVDAIGSTSVPAVVRAARSSSGTSRLEYCAKSACHEADTGERGNRQATPSKDEC
jgi:hypothetical protein